MIDEFHLNVAVAKLRRKGRLVLSELFPVLFYVLHIPLEEVSNAIRIVAYA